MTDTNDGASNHWKKAVLFFEKNLQLDPEQLQNNILFQALDEHVKSKVMILFLNKKQGHTILDQPGTYLLNNVLNQDLSGQSIDTYELIELIAHGGMSSIYRARKTDTQAQKDVAIKLIPANLQTDHTISLFKQELKTLSQLHHPNIISMHHGDVSKSGTPYLVMELIENALQIDHFFKQQKTSLNNIIDQFIILCHVISYAHQNGVIHQDIKPSNVLLDEHGHLLVLDFGVAALAEVIPDHHAYTLSYAAPEQKLKRSIAQPWFDTYAITSLLIKCLSQCSDHDVNWQNTALNELKINSDLHFILKKGINQDPEKRYQSANQMALDLNLWLQKLPISDLRNNSLYRIKKVLSRHPLTSALICFTAIAMLIGIIFYQQQYQLAYSESIKASQIKNILIEAIKQNDPDISKGNNLTVKDMLKQVEISVSENPTTDLSTAKELYMTLAMAFNKLGDYNAAEKNIKVVLSIEPHHTLALLELTELKTTQKQADETSELLLKLKRNLPFNEPENTIKYHLLSAKLHLINNAFELADADFKTANLLAKKVDDVNSKIKVLAEHAEGLFEKHQMEPATEKMADAIVLSEEYFGPMHSRTLELKAKMAEIYLSSSSEKVIQAINIYHEIIPQQKTLLGNEHPIVAKSLFLNATGLRSLNRLSEARENATQALLIAQQHFGEDHIFTGRILMNLGGINIAEGNVEKAIGFAQMAVKNHEKHYGKEHPETLQYKTSYAAMLVKDQQYQKALELLVEIHPIQTQQLGSQHRATLYVETTLAKVYAALGRLTESVSIGEQCLNSAKQNDTQNITEVYCALNLENAYFLSKQYSKSAALIDQYQDDPFILNQPEIINRFKAHQEFINKMEVISNKK
jgi:serine/threonine-protein kinase